MLHYLLAPPWHDDSPAYTEPAPFKYALVARAVLVLFTNSPTPYCWSSYPPPAPYPTPAPLNTLPHPLVLLLLLLTLPHPVILLLFLLLLTLTTHIWPVVRFYNVFVPTTDSVLYTHLLESLAPRKPLLFVGESGTAKTMTIQNYLGSLSPDSNMKLNMNFSSRTTSLDVQVGAGLDCVAPDSSSSCDSALAALDYWVPTVFEHGTCCSQSVPHARRIMACM